MNDLNSHSSLRFEASGEESQSWRDFANRLRESQSWGSDWFAIARRFFLSGGAKQFKPDQDDVDRVVDYATALESTLVPENDYITRRLARRAAALIAPDDPPENEGIAKLIKRCYEIRSRIVHGNGLGDNNRKWLEDEWHGFELRVRKVLVTAVRNLPPEEQDRRAALAKLYDLSDEDRGNSALEKFKEIKTAEVRSAIATKIGQLIAE